MHRVALDGHEIHGGHADSKRCNHLTSLNEGADGQPVPGLYAAGEVAGLGGGVHGPRRHIPGGVSSRVAQPNRPPQKRSGDGNG
jgi:hypothetical protein